MRLAFCTLSAVLLSGCSWLGYGGGGNTGFATNANCGAYGGQYGQAAYGANGCGGGVGGYGAGYGANGYGLSGGMGGGYGANGYGVGTGALGHAGGLRGVQGAGAYGAGFGGAGMPGAAMGGYGAGAGNYGAGGLATTGGQFINGQWVAGTAAGGAGTVLGGSAPYGSAAGGQFINGQWVAGGATRVAGGYGTSGSVTTVQGAPIYVPQPYPAYYGVATSVTTGGGYAYGGGLRGGYAALPFGIEAGVGTEISVGGDIFPGAPAKPAGTNFISAIDPIAYKDAYDNAVTYEMAATFDVDSSTTLLGRVGYSEAKGQRIKIGTIDDGALVSEDLFAQWGDTEQFTLEGGVRKYMGGWNNSMSGIRPYVQATAGFSHNNAINLVQDSAILAPAALNVQRYTDAGWTPTASGVVGAEMQVGPRTALGVEAGIRWRDDLNTNLASEDRWSVPIKLRGRVSF